MEQGTSHPELQGQQLDIAHDGSVRLRRLHVMVAGGQMGFLKAQRHRYLAF